MNPCLIDVKDILDAHGLSVEVDGEYAVAQFTVGDEVFTLTRPAVFHASITHAGAGYVLIGSVAADVLATCSRCLCDFPMKVEGELEGLWIGSSDVLTDEAAGRVTEQGTIDISDALVSALVVEAPFAPLHDDECAGLCISCGADLNVEECSCGDTADETHPFAVLKALLASSEPDSDT